MHLPLGMDLMWMGAPWVLVLVVVVILVARRNGGPESPESILKRRYANGEISKDQYESMLQDLRR